MNVHDGDDLELANYQSCFPPKMLNIHNQMVHVTEYYMHMWSDKRRLDDGRSSQQIQVAFSLIKQLTRLVYFQTPISCEGYPC